MKNKYACLAVATAAAAAFACGCLISKIRAKKISEEQEPSSDESIRELVHDMKGPVTSIIGYSGAIADKVVPEEKIDGVAAIIKNEGEKLSQMISSMLYVGEKDPASFEEFDLNALVKETLIEYEGRINGKNLAVLFDSEDSPVWVKAEKRAIYRVVSNLIDNAVKYSYENTTLVLKLKKRDGEVLCSVYNEGIGIKPVDMPHIFSKYYRSEKTGEKGAGLGLFICKRIINAHGGTIFVRTKEKEFCEVSFTLES